MLDFSGPFGSGARVMKCETCGGTKEWHGSLRTGSMRCERCDGEERPEPLAGIAPLVTDPANVAAARDRMRAYEDYENLFSVCCPYCARAHGHIDQLLCDEKYNDDEATVTRHSIAVGTTYIFDGGASDD